MTPKAGTDSEIDRLYAAAPGEFVSRRDDLVRSLRKEGDREAADQVKKLRKPTVAAWAVNQLARREKMRLRGLFTAGERLRAAHGELLGGGSPEVLERARDDERKAIEELVGAARSLLEEAGQPPSESVLVRVRETLHAAVVDEHLGERVRAGRLDKEEQATGFGFTSLPEASATRPAPARRKGDEAAAPGAAREKQRQAKEAAQEKRRQSEERLREARRAVVEAERVVKDRERELKRAGSELEKRLAAVERAERELEEERTPRG